MEGKLLIFCAPSGSGKSTIVQHLMKTDPSLAFSISATSRKPRQGEVNGREYHFLSPKQFREKIKNNEFVEWEEVYPEQYYGTLKSEVKRIWSTGHHALFDIDVAGGLNLKKAFGNKALAIFVMPPSKAILEERLRSRGTDDEASLQKRLGKAEYELSFAPEFDRILINDSLQRALVEAESMVIDFLSIKTGLYFGSFNPIHIGHLAIANYMIEYTDLQQLWFIVSPQNPLKEKKTLLTDHHRLEMVRLALEDDYRFRVSDIEFRLPVPSYTINTLKYLEEKNPGHKFQLIMGADQLKTFQKWKNADLIAQNYHRLIYPRPGVDPETIKALPNATLVNAPLMEISSSFIRKAIKAGKDIRHLVPAKAYTYMREMHFYEK
ncbi:MAG: guanylate kinase [Bacteroidales bacterium]